MMATYVTDATELRWAGVLIESLREFGGRFRGCRVVVYYPESKPALLDRQLTFPDDVERFTCPVPVEAADFPYAFKVFAAAEAEQLAFNAGKVLIWIDPDAVVVQEPVQWELPDATTVAYRPVMHELIGPKYDEPIDKFWRTAYGLLGVEHSLLFPMTTPVDNVTLRAYFNAGMLILRPAAGIFRTWPVCFRQLYESSEMRSLCAGHDLRTIFLHQVALVGAILKTVDQKQLHELPINYNYPLNLDRECCQQNRPATLDDVTVLRHDLFWQDKSLKGLKRDSSEILKWIRNRLPNTEVN